jgi:hypothetical protein
MKLMGEKFEEFIKRAIAEYEEWPGYVQGLLTKEGDIIWELLMRGKSLDVNVKVNQMLAAIEAGDSSPEMAMMKASLEKCRRRQELYREWQESQITQVGKYLPKEGG